MSAVLKSPRMFESENLTPYSQAWYERFRNTLGEGLCRQLGIYAIHPDTVLSVVIPVYNERATLLDLVDRVRRVPLRKQIILVDDGSKDGTRDVLRDLEANPRHDDMNTIHVVFHEVNRGKGAALRTGFQYATGEFVIVQDADNEYDPSEFPRLLQPLVEDKADVVYGSRFMGDYSHRVLYYWHYLGNKFLTTLSNCFTNLNLTDMETCYKVFRRDKLAEILPTLKQNRFGFEPEITAKIARRRLRIYEQSISYSGRTYDQGKKIGWRDGFKALWCIVRYAIAD
ncbi:MAG: glycosyltransferase family 2 protein [Planctomycetes bacterium]|nr:glycosyltransferase family 2 protein [Planctomycetota bacterium]